MKYFISFDKENEQKNYIAENYCNTPDTSGFKINHDYTAPDGFDPDINFCKLVNNQAVLMTDLEKMDYIAKKDLQNLIFLAKLSLKSKVEKFYDIGARLIRITNGHIQPVLVDQKFTNNLESAKSQANSNIDKCYYHKLTDYQGNFILENNKNITTKLTIETLEKIESITHARRGYCHNIKYFHFAIIDLLTDLDKINIYNIMVDSDGKQYKPTKEIRVNKDGNIISFNN